MAEQRNDNRTDRTNGNIFAYKLPAVMPGESFELLIPDRGVLIERIISVGSEDEEENWYDQERDEWVILLQGKAVLVWANGERLPLAAGDWVYIPAHHRHRVAETSAQPPCVWLAVHGRLG